jgi:hypothetical protein
MFLSKLGYSELVQRLFENITFFLVDPLLQRRILICALRGYIWGVQESTLAKWIV